MINDLKSIVFDEWELTMENDNESCYMRRAGCGCRLPKCTLAESRQGNHSLEVEIAQTNFVEEQQVGCTICMWDV